MQLDNSTRNTYATCMRKGYWENQRHLKTNLGKTALRYGSTWHGVMEGYYGAIKKYGWTHDGKAVEEGIKLGKKKWEDTEGQEYYEDYRTLENCLQSFLVYISHFAHDEGMLKVRNVERKFKIRLKLTDREKKLFPLLADEEDGIIFTGRLDTDVTLDGRNWQLEHKSTGQSLSVQKLRLQRNPQNIGYDYANKIISGEPLEGCLIILHHLSAYKSKKTGLWGSPKIDFDRVPQIYTEEDHMAWRQSFLYTAERICWSKKHNIWPEEFDNCHQFGRCPFTELCDQKVPLGEETLENFFVSEPWDPAPGTEIVEEG